MKGISLKSIAFSSLLALSPLIGQAQKASLPDSLGKVKTYTLPEKGGVYTMLKNIGANTGAANDIKSKLDSMQVTLQPQEYKTLQKGDTVYIIFSVKYNGSYVRKALELLPDGSYKFVMEGASSENLLHTLLGNGEYTEPEKDTRREINIDGDGDGNENATEPENTFELSGIDNTLYEALGGAYATTVERYLQEHNLITHEGEYSYETFIDPLTDQEVLEITGVFGSREQDGVYQTLTITVPNDNEKSNFIKPGQTITATVDSMLNISSNTKKSIWTILEQLSRQNPSILLDVGDMKNSLTADTVIITVPVVQNRKKGTITFTEKDDTLQEVVYSDGLILVAEAPATTPVEALAATPVADTPAATPVDTLALAPVADALAPAPVADTLAPAPVADTLAPAPAVERNASTNIQFSLSHSRERVTKSVISLLDDMQGIQFNKDALAKAIIAHIGYDNMKDGYDITYTYKYTITSGKKVLDIIQVTGDANNKKRVFKLKNGGHGFLLTQ